MNSNTLIETATHRLRIVDTEHAESPDFDFQGQIIRQDGRRFEAFHRDAARDSLADEIRVAWDRFMDMDLIERYLRIFFDVVGFDYFDLRDGRIICVVTLAELRAWGFKDVEAWREKNGGDPVAVGILKPWQAWVDGDVFGYIIEEKVRTARLDDHDQPIMPTVTEGWDEVDSCYGFYGTEDVEQAAREQFSAMTGQPESVDA